METLSKSRISHTFNFSNNQNEQGPLLEWDYNDSEECSEDYDDDIYF